MWKPSGKTVSAVAKAVAVLGLAAATFLLVESSRKRDWKTTKGYVVASRLLDQYAPINWRRPWREGVKLWLTEPEGKASRYALEYSYRVGSQSYSGADTTIGKWQDGFEVYYNPQHPAESALSRGPDSMSFLSVIALSFIAYVVARVAGARK